MSLDYNEVKDFYQYLDRSKSGMVLKKDAPESAKKAFKEYKEAEKRAEKKGVKI